MRPLGGKLVDPQVPRAFGSQTVLRYDATRRSGGGEGEGGGGEGVARGFWAQTEGLMRMLFGMQKRPSAHVCCSGQQVEPSTGNFGWHVAEVSGRTMPRTQSTTQVRPLQGMLVDPQVPRAFGSQTVLR